MPIFNIDYYDDILSLWHSSYIDILPERRKDKLSPPVFLNKILRILKILVKDLIEVFIPNRFDSNPTDKILLLVSTKNNYDAVKFLEEEEGFVFFKPMRVKRYFTKVENIIRYRFKFFYDLFFPLFLIQYLNQTDNKNAGELWDYSFNAVGLLEESVRWLRKYEPKAVLFSNDHSIEQRAMLNAAKRLSIPTIYIQHASVSEYFPPLKFDLSLLEGQDAFKKYREISNVEGKVELVGMVHSEKFKKLRNLSNQIKSIGICYGPNDPIEEVKDIVNKLEENVSQEIFARPHPADDRKIDNSKIKISNSKEVEAIQFLSQMDCIIAGNSSIHLEAVMLNVFSIYYEFNKNSKMYDYYGFLENELIIEACTYSDLINIIQKYEQERPKIYKKAKYYNFAVDETEDNPVQDKITDIIKDFV